MKSGGREIIAFSLPPSFFPFEYQYAYVVVVCTTVVRSRPSFVLIHLFFLLLFVDTIMMTGRL